MAEPNQISDIVPLTNLGLYSNQISDISALAKCAIIYVIMYNVLTTDISAILSIMDIRPTEHCT